MDLNSREQALLIWSALCLVGIMLSPGIRPSFVLLVRQLLHRKIVDVVGLAGFYATACVGVLERVGVWEWRNLKTTIVWFLTTAFVAMADTKALDRGPSTLMAVGREATKVTAIVIFIGGVNTLPLWAELLLVPLLTFASMMAASAKSVPEHRTVAVLFNAVLTCAALFILGYSLYRIVDDWQQFDTGFQAREFTVPIALTILFLPYLYGLMIYVQFENAAIRLGFKIKDRSLRRYAFCRGAFVFGLNPQSFRRFVRAIQMADVNDRKDVRRVVETMRGARRREKQREFIDWNQGWAPYEARDFLRDHELRTEPYDPSVVDWSASSAYLKLNRDVLADDLVYRISGSECAVTELELELNVKLASDAPESDRSFWVISSDLVRRALGDETADRFIKLLPTDEQNSIPAGKLMVELKREDWRNGERSGYSRTLTIRHPAYVNPFSHFE